MLLAIRPSDTANSISIPTAILKTLNLSAGASLNLTIENNRIVLTPATGLLTLEDLLKGTPKESLVINDEDRAWLNATPIGKEIL